MSQEIPHNRRSLEDFAEIASDWFWETDAAHRFTFLSGRVEDTLQIDRKSILGRRRDDLTSAQVNPEDFAAHLSDLEAHRPFRSFEYCFTRPTDKKQLWLRVSGQPLFDARGAFLGYRGVGADITAEREAMEVLKKTNAALAARNAELKDTQRALERSEDGDTLTGMLNRAVFEADLKEALEQTSALIVIVYIDLDRFKWINDSLGHTAGDHVLTISAERIRRIASGLGPVYRVGGNEFTVLLADNATLERAYWIGDAVLEALRAPITVEAQKVAISASIGIASGHGGEMSAGELISNADIAMSFAKLDGRGTVREITPELLNDIAAKRQLAIDLPEALADGRIVPFFQPQIAAQSEAVVGAEVLARWDHPEHGIMAPAAFLPVAAELQLLPAIDHSMLTQALAFVETAQKAGLWLPSISVNLSAGRLMDPKLPDDIASCWTNRQCQLSIELLETISFDEFDRNPVVTDNLRRLRDMGVKIEIDDFGSARASITSLLHVRPDRVKIDRSLVQSAVHDPIKREVVGAILDMTGALGMETLAEGVEDAEEVAIIRKLGFSVFQGYAYARPLAASDFMEYLQRNILSDIKKRRA